MSLKKDSANLRNESLLTNKTEVRIAIRAANSDIFFENVFRTSTRTSSHHMTITAKSLRQQKLSL